MVRLSRQVREELRVRKIRTGNEKRWQLQEKQFLEKMLHCKSWTVKGVITRLYGQGAQTLFATFPKYHNVAVAGSAAVALYDILSRKKDIHWHPDVVKVFVAVPFELMKEPLSMAFHVIIEWLDEARDKGFDYHLEKDGKKFEHRTISFMFECRNASEHATVKMPRVLFLIRCAASVRDMCNRLDLTVSSPMLGRRRGGYGMALHMTNEVRNAFKHRVCLCTSAFLDFEALQTMVKYSLRGFQVAQGFNRAWYRLRPRDPYPGGVSYKNPDVTVLLGRKLTLREAEEFFPELVA